MSHYPMQITDPQLSHVGKKNFVRKKSLSGCARHAGMKAYALLEEGKPLVCQQKDELVCVQMRANVQAQVRHLKSSSNVGMPFFPWTKPAECRFGICPNSKLSCTLQMCRGGIRCLRRTIEESRAAARGWHDRLGPEKGEQRCSRATPL